MMNTNTNKQTNHENPVVVLSKEKQQAKFCSKCKTELKVSDNIHHTRFGLDLCEDCLYF